MRPVYHRAINGVEWKAAMERVIDGVTLWTGAEKLGMAASWMGTIAVKNEAGEGAVHEILDSDSHDPIKAEIHAEKRLREVVGVGPDFELIF